MNQKLMKKSLITLAVLGAFAGAAQAQTSDQSVVTLYGSFDAGVRDVNHVNTNGDSKWTMGSAGQYNSNRLGFKGTEDLGGGNNAHFDLEIGFNSGTGQLDVAATRNNLFDRQAFVGLGGKWGSLDLGRQYSVSFKTIYGYDPFHYQYTAIIPLAAAAAGTSYYNAFSGNPLLGATYYGGTRFNNDIQYTGTFGPVTARAEYSLGEQTGSTSNGAAQALGLGYAGGPVSIAAAYTEKKPNIAASGAANFQQNKQLTVGGAFTAGPLRASLGYIEEKNATGTSAGDGKIKNLWGGLAFKAGSAVEVTGAVYQTKGTLSGILDAKKTLYIAGVTYFFSKRTNFYADIDQARYSGGININGYDKQNGVSVGINTTF
jgi:predicted porin